LEDKELDLGFGDAGEITILGRYCKKHIDDAYDKHKPKPQPNVSDELVDEMLDSIFRNRW